LFTATLAFPTAMKVACVPFAVVTETIRFPLLFADDPLERFATKTCDPLPLLAFITRIPCESS